MRSSTGCASSIMPPASAFIMAARIDLFSSLENVVRFQNSFNDHLDMKFGAGTIICGKQSF